MLLIVEMKKKLHLINNLEFQNTKKKCMSLQTKCE